MKLICKAGMIAIVALILNVKTSGAQEENPGESAGALFVKNKVPGLRYGPEKRSNDANKTEKPKSYAKGDFKSTLNEGKSQPAATARSTARRTVNNVARTAQQPLPSDKPAEKKELPKVEPPKPPSQGDEKKVQ